jgi:hypothetical protein
VPYLRKAGPAACGPALTEDTVFYRFDVFPEILKRRFPRFCIDVGRFLERLGRSPLRYFGGALVVKARKAY